MRQAFKRGIFKEELKNRFLCLVEIDGRDILCYIPASCRLSNFINLVGKEVILSPIVSPGARTKYSIYALFERNNFILLNMSKTNEVVINNIRSRRFYALGKRLHVRKEYKVDGYKSDLFIEDTKTVVEIKSILSFDNIEARFPSVYSERAIKQLIKLSALLDEGYNVCYIFVSLNPIIKRLVINKDIREFKDWFHGCVKKGMKVKGVSLKLIDGEPVIYSSLPVII